MIHCCVNEVADESILRPNGPKIVFQQPQPKAANPASTGRTEMIVVRAEHRAIPMTLKTAYCRSQFDGYLGNVGFLVAFGLLSGFS